MKKAVFVLCLVICLAVAGCGGKEGALDTKQVHEAVAEGALKEKDIQDGQYTKDDIQVLKACKAIKKGKEQFGFDGYYLVYWQTKDKKYQRSFVLKDNQVSYGTNIYNPTDECQKIDK